MEHLEEIVSKTGDLPALSQVASKVLDLIHDPSTKTKDLEEVIGRDPALTAKVLRIANSAFYGVRGTVATLQRGIVVLGFNTLRSVILASSAARLYRGDNSSGFKDMILWEHALATAIAARELAQRSDIALSEEAFIAGLLHDIGKGVLDRSLGDEYTAVIESVYNDGRTFVEAEQDLLGFDHSEVGALVVQKWGLTAGMVEAVRLHHRPGQADAAPRLCAMIATANGICVRLGIGPERDRNLDLKTLDPLSQLSFDPAEVDEIAAVVQQKLKEEKGLLAI